METEGIFDTSGNRVGGAIAVGDGDTAIWDERRQVGLLTVTGEIWIGNGAKLVGLARDCEVWSANSANFGQAQPEQLIGEYDMNTGEVFTVRSQHGAFERDQKLGYAEPAITAPAGAALLLVLRASKHDHSLVQALGSMAMSVAALDSPDTCSEEPTRLRFASGDQSPHAESFMHAEIERDKTRTSRELLESLAAIVPIGEHDALTWSIENRVITTEYLRYIVGIRRVQYMEGDYSPDMTWH